MTRVERDGSVTYVERHGAFSLVLVGCAVAVAVVPAIRPPSDPGEALRCFAWSIGLAVAALAALFRGRAFHIDAEAGLLRLVDRGLLRRTERREYPLRGLNVRSTMSEDNMGSRRWYIWIDVPGLPSIRFAGNLRMQERVHDLIVRLRDDLGC